MKLSKEELKKKIDEVVQDDEVKISLLEDIEDSIDVADESEKVEKSAYDELKTKYEEIKQKYKDRFLKGEEPEEKEDEETEDEELKEEEVIDIKEI
jgi:hypothetical protein